MKTQSKKSIAQINRNCGCQCEICTCENCQCGKSCNCGNTCGCGAACHC